MPVITLAAVLCVSAIGCAPETSTETATPYPLDTCIVSGEKLGEEDDMEAYTFVHEGQEIRLCCESCLKSFNKEPEKYLAKLKEPMKPTLHE